MWTLGWHDRAWLKCLAWERRALAVDAVAVGQVLRELRGVVQIELIGIGKIVVHGRVRVGRGVSLGEHAVAQILLPLVHRRMHLD